MTPYRLLIAWSVIEFLDGRPLKDRRMLRERFVAMIEWPERFSDYRETDSTGRFLDVHICGRYAIRYWADFADRHLKILEVSLADA